MYMQKVITLSASFIKWISIKLRYEIYLFYVLDVNDKEWKEHKKHIFILSEAGKPIYSRLVYSEFWLY